MGYVIEPRIMSCVYQNYPYVGDAWTARWFVFDDKTGAVLANNKGKGYKTYQKAYWAYQWKLKGPPSVKVKQQEQEFIYAWSLKNKMITDRLDRMAMTYEQEGTRMTPKHIKMLFDSQRTTCPIDEDKFLLAYKNGFYKEEILERSRKQKQKAKLKENLAVKQKFDKYAEKSTTINTIIDTSDRVAVILSPVAQYLHNLGKMHEDRPTSEDTTQQARRMHYISDVQVVHHDKPFVGHEWEVVPTDDNINPIYDTFGQEGPSQITRVMDREHLQHPHRSVYGSSHLDMMVDPISHQIVPKRTTRCVSPQEWTQMAGTPKKKKKRPATSAKAPLTTEDWVGQPEENVIQERVKQVSKSRPRVEPEDVSASVTVGKTTSNTQRQRTEKSQKAPKEKAPSFKSKVRAKMQALKEEWSYEDDEEDDCEVPTVQDVMTQLKEKVSNFFTDVKQEADKQKADEAARKEKKKQARLDKKVASHTSNVVDKAPEAEEKESVSDLDLEFLSGEIEDIDSMVADDHIVDQIIDEIMNDSDTEHVSL